jgi:hypothetical protein
MKKLMIILTIILCISCIKEPIERTIPGNVNVTIDYAFPTRSGDITAKSLEPGIYLNFYNKYISSKVLTPRTYYLEFDGMNNNHYSTGASGIWGSKMLITLAPDRYVVKGYSHPTKYPVCGDTCYLKFHDTIDITHTSTNITLKAYYDCSLILLDTTNVKKTLFFADTTTWTFNMQFSNAVKKTMMKTEDFYHSFYSEGPANGDGYDKTQLYLTVTSRQWERPMPETPTPSNPHPSNTPVNKSSIIALWLYTWTAGKYYYFEDTSDAYILTPMTGN